MSGIVVSREVAVVSLLFLNYKSIAMNTNQKDPGCCGGDSGCCSMTDMGCC